MESDRLFDARHTSGHPSSMITYGAPCPGSARRRIKFQVLDDDQPLGLGEVGELVFRHPRGQLTYYENRPEATAEDHRGGWFHTGELAEYDEDGETGYAATVAGNMLRSFLIQWTARP